MKRSWPSEQVIAAAQSGDEASISALVSESHPLVQRFASVLCASGQDAEDAAQEALIVLFRKIGTLRATGALASWMFQIVRHECVRRAIGLASLVLLLAGVVALRGCSTCWAIGLVQTVSRGRLERSCVDGRCELSVRPPAGSDSAAAPAAGQ